MTIEKARSIAKMVHILLKFDIIDVQTYHDLVDHITVCCLTKS